MQLLKQSTAATILVGPVLDSAGAPITSAVIGDFSIAKNGTTSALAAGATATSVGNGYYQIALIAGNVDAAGRFVVYVNAGTMSMGTHHYTVLVASVFDALVTNATNTAGGLPAATGAVSALAGALSTFAGGAVASVTARVTANADQLAGQTITAAAGVTFPTSVASPTNITAGTITTVTTLTNLPTIPANWLTAAGIAADAITAAKIATDAVAEIQAGLATAAQIPANFTTATFASAGVFAVAALANAPSGTGASAASIRAEMDANSTKLANLDVVLSTRLATSAYTAPTTPPTAVQNRQEMDTNSMGLAAIFARTDVATSTRMATFTYTAPLDAAGTRSAVGLAAANLDTQLTAIDDFLDTEVAAIKAKTDNLPAAPAAVGDIPTAVVNADALLNRNIAGGSSTGRTVKQAFASQRNKVAFDVPSAGSFTVYDTDDTTALWTGTYTAGTASTYPVVTLDPG